MMARVGPPPTSSSLQSGSADPNPFGVRDYERPSVALQAIESADSAWVTRAAAAVDMSVPDRHLYG